MVRQDWSQVQQQDFRRVPPFWVLPSSLFFRIGAPLAVNLWTLIQIPFPRKYALFIVLVGPPPLSKCRRRRHSHLIRTWLVQTVLNHFRSHLLMRSRHCHGFSPSSSLLLAFLIPRYPSQSVQKYKKKRFVSFLSNKAHRSSHILPFFTLYTFFNSFDFNSLLTVGFCLSFITPLWFFLAAGFSYHHIFAHTSFDESSESSQSLLLLLPSLSPSSLTPSSLSSPLSLSSSSYLLLRCHEILLRESVAFRDFHNEFFSSRKLYGEPYPKISNVVFVFVWPPLESYGISYQNLAIDFYMYLLKIVHRFKSGHIVQTYAVTFILGNKNVTVISLIENWVLGKTNTVQSPKIEKKYKSKNGITSWISSVCVSFILHPISILSMTMTSTQDFGNVPLVAKVCPKCVSGEMSIGKAMDPQPSTIQQHSSWCSAAQCPKCEYQWYICRDCKFVRTILNTEDKMKTHAAKFHNQGVARNANRSLTTKRKSRSDKVPPPIFEMARVNLIRDSLLQKKLKSAEEDITFPLCGEDTLANIWWQENWKGRTFLEEGKRDHKMGYGSIGLSIWTCPLRMWTALKLQTICGPSTEGGMCIVYTQKVCLRLWQKAGLLKSSLEKLPSIKKRMNPTRTNMWNRNIAIPIIVVGLDLIEVNLLLISNKKDVFLICKSRLFGHIKASSLIYIKTQPHTFITKNWSTEMFGISCLDQEEVESDDEYLEQKYRNPLSTGWI